MRGSFSAMLRNSISSDRVSKAVRSPHANVLVLVGQVETVPVVVVERPYGSRCAPEKVLNTSLRGQVPEVAGKLCDLSYQEQEKSLKKVKWSHG